MNTDDFARILFLALRDPDERLSSLARELKAAIERGDTDAASEGLRAVSKRMGQLRVLRRPYPEEPEPRRGRR